MPKKKKRIRVNRDGKEIRRIVRDFHKSGLSQVAFAQSRRIHPSVLGRWIRQERDIRSTNRRKTSRNRVIPVRIRPSTSADSGDEKGIFELVLTNGRRIRLSDGFSEGALLRLINILEAPC